MVTTVGNEHGQVLLRVLTAKEGCGLAVMVSSLIRRYATAGVEPPQLLYVDQDCCESSKGNALFPIWALSHGIKSQTLYAVLQQNPSSKLSSEPHYSSQPMDQTPEFSFFPLPVIPQPHRQFLLTCLYRCVHAAHMPVCVRVCVCYEVCECAFLLIFYVLALVKQLFICRNVLDQTVSSSSAN